MATESMTFVKSSGDKFLVCVHRWSDGYLSDQGRCVADVIKLLYYHDDEEELAFGLVAKMNERMGDFGLALWTPTLGSLMYCDYAYEVYRDRAARVLKMRVFRPHTADGKNVTLEELLFDGTPEELYAFLEQNPES